MCGKWSSHELQDFFHKPEGNSLLQCYINSQRHGRSCTAICWRNWYQQVKLHATAEDVRAVSDNGPELRDGFYERLHRNVEENSQFITLLWVRTRQHSSSVLQWICITACTCDLKTRIFTYKRPWIYGHLQTWCRTGLLRARTDFKRTVTGSQYLNVLVVAIVLDIQQSYGD